MARCDIIKQRLDALIELREEIVEELHQPGLPPAQRAELIHELKLVGQAIANAKREYEQCVDSQLPRPDLVAQTFQITRQAKTISVAGVIVNRGEAAARGPFKVTLGVSFTPPDGQFQTRQLDVLIPSTTTIEGFGTTFVTPPMTNIPLVGGIYTLEMIVDADQQVRESIESNNYVRIDWRAFFANPTPR